MSISLKPINIIKARVDETIRKFDVPEDIIKWHDSSNSLENEATESWLCWATSHKWLKLISHVVPQGIFPSYSIAKLTDVKVQGEKYESDDRLYNQHSDLRQNVARGSCVLTYSDRNSSSKSQFVIFALRKFTGGLGDEDDIDSQEASSDIIWQEYFLQPLDNCREVVSTQKENGEAAHLSAIHLFDQFFVILGSKNVHIITNSREQIELYSGDRYSFAKKIAHAFYSMIEDWNSDDISDFYSYLHFTRQTAVMEFLDPQHQHVVNLESMKSPKLKFITFTTNDVVLNKDFTSLCSMPPHIALQLGKEFKLDCVHYHLTHPNDLDNLFTEIRQGYGFEGEVLYFLDQSQNIIGVLKKKSVWYIMLRAIREKVKRAVRLNKKKPSPRIISETKKKIEERLDQIKLWVKIDDQCCTKWKDMSGQFVEWLFTTLPKHLNLYRVSDQFPVFWAEFLTNKSLSDNFI